MPFVNQQHSCHEYRYGYVATDGFSDRFWSNLARVDTFTGKVETYEFVKGQYCTEPVFVPIPGFQYSDRSADEPGWLLTEAYC